MKPKPITKKLMGEYIMTVQLYRGISNEYEYNMIVQERTAGGQRTFNDNVDPSYPNIYLKMGAKNPPRFSDLDNPSLETFRSYQAGTGGERFPQITNIPKLRPIIEYTTNSELAFNFGLYGCVKIEIAEEYCENNGQPTGLESSVFCISCASITLLNFFVK